MILKKKEDTAEKQQKPKRYGWQEKTQQKPKQYFGQWKTKLQTTHTQKDTAGNGRHSR